MVFAKAFTNVSNESNSILLICILGNNLKKKEREEKRLLQRFLRYTQTQDLIKMPTGSRSVQNK